MGDVTAGILPSSDGRTTRAKEKDAKYRLGTVWGRFLSVSMLLFSVNYRKIITVANECLALAMRAGLGSEGGEAFNPTGKFFTRPNRTTFLSVRPPNGMLMSAPRRNIECPLGSGFTFFACLSTRQLTKSLSDRFDSEAPTRRKGEQDKTFPGSALVSPDGCCVIHVGVPIRRIKFHRSSECAPLLKSRSRLFFVLPLSLSASLSRLTNSRTSPKALGNICAVLCESSHHGGIGGSSLRYKVFFYAKIMTPPGVTEDHFPAGGYCCPLRYVSAALERFGSSTSSVC
ncbi:hypothetical protein ZHAS_00014018 [Anopheles sinensis]|uniref:Uncharacterized protein n=1 Tax=Anopheles sinensis TaxID=74873 RepID=A0A084W751_ANOSI|nr:hypothetical protein ZHAS_00014018 [Anopheles sinensis]